MSDKCKIILFSFKSNKNTRQQTHLMMRSVMTGGVAHWVVATREGPLRAGRPCRRQDESEKRENGRGKSVAVRAKCDGGGSIKWERERESERRREWERERVRERKRDRHHYCRRHHCHRHHCRQRTFSRFNAYIFSKWIPFMGIQRSSQSKIFNINGSCERASAVVWKRKEELWRRVCRNEKVMWGGGGRGGGKERGRLENFSNFKNIKF